MCRTWVKCIQLGVVLLVVSTCSFAASSFEILASQGPPTGSVSVWDGIYTAAQATRGKPLYEMHCGSCHGADLSGGIGQSLKGEFIRYWEGYSLNSLFSRTKYTMPSGAPASLRDEEYLDIIAYILQVSSFPAGTRDIITNGLENVRIEGKEGPRPIPNYSLVRVVGCLTPGAQNSWTLSNSTTPVLTRDPEASRDEERRDSMTKALGNLQLPLRSIYPAPDTFRGHKVEVKGFWIQGANQHVNVNALQTLASTCAR
jgi:cytochrome c5